MDVRAGHSRCSDGDAELLLRMRHGDSAAFEILYEKFLALATAYAGVFGGRDVTVADVVQEAFTRLWDRRHKYRGEASARAYVFAYIRNVCLEEGRLRRKSRALSQCLVVSSLYRDVPSPGPESQAYSNEMNERLEEALARLSRTQQQAMRLYYTEGMSLREAAAFVGCTQKCFESRLYRGLAKLRCLLSHPGRCRQGRRTEHSIA